MPLGHLFVNVNDGKSSGSNDSNGNAGSDKGALNSLGEKPVLKGDNALLEMNCRRLFKSLAIFNFSTEFLFSV